MGHSIGGIGVQPGGVGGQAGVIAAFAGTVVVRAPVLQVYIGGTLDSRAYAARCSFGFDQRYAEATVWRTGGTRYPSGGSEPSIGYWSEVEIRMGATAGSVNTRFRGWVVPLDNAVWPQTGTLHCRGRLYLAEFVRNEVAGGTDLSEDGGGHADEGQVRTVLAACGVPYNAGNIEGTGQLLGSAFVDLGALANPDAPPPTPFWWRQGESGLAYIDRLDEVSVPSDSSGRYRTFESLDGTVYRRKLSTQPGGAADFTFTEGQDILPETATITRDPSRAANRVRVTGAPEPELGSVVEWTSQDPAASSYIPSAVPPASEGYRIVSAPDFSSPMIEKSTGAEEGDVLSAEQVANYLLGEYNAVLDTVTFSTPRDDLLGPAQTIWVTSPRLGIDRRHWLQHLDVEIDERGAFTQRLVCVVKS